jgi:uridine kinase
VSRDGARRVADLVEDRRETLGRRIAVGISGVDCAGKTTLAAELERELGERGLPSLVVAGDELTRPTRERYGEPDEGLGYYRDSFDYRELHEHLLPALRDGIVGKLRMRVSDWERDDWQAATFTLEPETVLIVEGCFLLTGPGRAAFDVSVWIDLPLDRVVERALARPRDLERMGGADGVRERYAARYLPGQMLHLQRDAPAAHADLVLDAG